MRIFTTLIASLVILVAAAPLTAQDLTVRYLEGTVELQSGNTWSIVKVGDHLSAKATLRLQADSVVELFGTSGTLHLRKSGLYSLATLKAKAESVASAANLLNGKLRALNQQDFLGSRNTTAGTRADRIEPEPPNWAGDMASDEASDVASTNDMDLARALLLEGKPEQALAKADSLLASRPENSTAVRLLRAQALIALDRPAAAALELERRPINKRSDPLWQDYRTILASTYLQLGEFDSANRLADEVLVTMPEQSAMQFFTLIKGLAASGRGQKAEARTLLARARDLAPQSDDGRIAADALARL